MKNNPKRSKAIKHNQTQPTNNPNHAKHKPNQSTPIKLKEEKASNKANTKTCNQKQSEIIQKQPDATKPIGHNQTQIRRNQTQPDAIKQQTKT